jgi:hypothetical protein
MTGFGTSRIAACSCSTGTPIVPRPCRADLASDGSPPTQKAFPPAPVSTMTLMSLFQPACRMASVISSYIPTRMAFSWSGRLSVTVAMLPVSS